MPFIYVVVQYFFIFGILLVFIYKWKTHEIDEFKPFPDAEFNAKSISEGIRNLFICYLFVCVYFNIVN